MRILHSFSFNFEVLNCFIFIRKISDCNRRAEPNLLTSKTATRLICSISALPSFTRLQ